MTGIAARSRRAKQRRLAIAAGTWRFRVPARPVVQHVQALHRAGMSAAAIAEAAHVPLSVVSPLIWAETHSTARQWVMPDTADALLRLTIRDAPDWAWIPADGTRRRIEALQCMGWSQQVLADRLGVSVPAVSKIKRQPRVQAAKARRIAAIYDDLSMRPGPDRRTKAWAAKQGYAPPLAWDDDAIDDPAAQPDGAGYTPGTALERVTELQEMGLSNEAIADRLGVRVDTVYVTARRARKENAA